MWMSKEILCDYLFFNVRDEDIFIVYREGGRWQEEGQTRVADWTRSKKGTKIGLISPTEGLDLLKRGAQVIILCKMRGKKMCKLVNSQILMKIFEQKVGRGKTRKVHISLWHFNYVHCLTERGSSREEILRR